MKNTFLFLLISSICFIACQKNSPPPEAQVATSVEAKKVDKKEKKQETKPFDSKRFVYLQELEEQKEKLNDKNKYWTARTIITDSNEKILDIDTSMDGKWILYVTKGKEYSYIYVLNTQLSTMPRMIFKDSRNIFWSRFNETSEKVLFSTSDNSENYYLNSILLNKSINQIPERINTESNGSIDTCSFSPQQIIAITIGDKILSDENGFSTFKGDSYLELKKDNLIFKNFKKARSPNWSYNGKSLVFMSNIFGQPEIVKWDVDERGLQRITTSKGGNDNPRFSPDNEWIIYNSNESGKSNIYITSLLSHTKKRITHMKDMQFYKPVWSKDGNIYAIGQKEHLSYLFQFKMEGKMFQVQINGEPGPGLTKMLSPIDNAQIELENE